MRRPALHVLLTAPALALATWWLLPTPLLGAGPDPLRPVLEQCGLAAPAAFVWIGLLLLVNRSFVGFLPVDVPRAGRKQHEHRTAMAGVAFAPLLAIAAVLDQRVALAGSLLAVAALGFVDDWRKERGRDLAWQPKTVVLGGAALALAATRFDMSAEPFAFALATTLAFVLTNAINFLDNMHGVASATAAACLFAASSGEGLFGFCGAVALGFLPWNWPRPHAFLGDAGAYALGLTCAAVCLEGLPDPHALAPFAVPLFDFAQVVIVRLCLRLPPWRGDRRHVSHVLHNAGVPLLLVAPLLAAVAVGIGVALRAD